MTSPILIYDSVKLHQATPGVASARKQGDARAQKDVPKRGFRHRRKIVFMPSFGAAKRIRRARLFLRSAFLLLQRDDKIGIRTAMLPHINSGNSVDAR